MFCFAFFLIIVYGTSLKTKHKQNFHLPFTITETGVLGTGGRSVCPGLAGAAPSSPLQQGENLRAEGRRKG